jgi:acid phosphatase family membrane protein YuiD
MKEMKLIVGNNDNTAAERYALHCEAISFTTSSSNMKKRSPFMKKVMTFNKKVKKNTGYLPIEILGLFVGALVGLLFFYLMYIILWVFIG